LGCDVLDIDIQTFLPHASLLTSRVARRLWSFRLVDELNISILRAAATFRPDIVVAFKGNYIRSGTLKSLIAGEIPLYNYFPDTSAFNHGKWLPQSLPLYDCVFYTKPFWYADVAKKLNLRAGSFLPHGYDRELHRPVELDARDITDYGCDVSFIANHSRYKESYLEQLIHLRPRLNLCIWGSGWASRCKSTALRKCIKGFPLLGERYTRAIQCSLVNLALMNGPVAGASSADLTTSRSYTIPASGGFMLHERNSEILDLYKEDEEIACFDTVEELAESIDYYLAHSVERENIARRGHARCVPAYSYDNRMAEMLRWHFKHHGTGNLQMAPAEVEAS
jgi:hypothetical protein